MHLPETLNAPRLCELAGRPFFVRALPLESWAVVLAWLDDVLPGRDGRENPPSLADEASQRALASSHGRQLLAWLGLRTAEPDMAYETASDLWDAASEGEQYRLLDVLMHRRRTLDRTPGGGAGDGTRTDLGELWCGESLADLAGMVGLEAMGRLSLDQLEWLQSGGRLDGHASPEARGYARAVELYNAAVARDGAGGHG